MVTFEDIITAYKVARRNKRKSPDQVEFELHWEANCYQLWQQVVRREVRPAAYTFIVDVPRPREVFASDMGTRVLHHYLDMRLRPLLEQRLSDHTFNNRRGMGQTAMQNAVISDIYETSKGFTEDCYIVKLDLSGCFPNIRQDIAYRQLEEVIVNSYFGRDKDELLYMLRVCVFSYPTLYCYRKSPLGKWALIPKEKSVFNKPLGVGAAIGHLLWQNAVNYYFHEIDEWILELCEQYGMRYERFVDDFVFVIKDKRILSYLVPELRKRLAELGATLNERKFYCQHYKKGVECVGVHIKMDRVYANSRIVGRGIRAARTCNRKVSASRVQRTISSLNSYLGMCKNVNGYNQAMRIMRELKPEWWDYLVLNKRRVCLQPKPQYTERNRIIRKHKLLKHETARKKRAAKQAA
jgi:hypothetical protein